MGNRNFLLKTVIILILVLVVLPIETLAVMYEDMEGEEEIESIYADATVLYVDKTAKEGGDGLSKEKPFNAINRSNTKRKEEKEDEDEVVRPIESLEDALDEIYFHVMEGYGNHKLKEIVILDGDFEEDILEINIPIFNNLRVKGIGVEKTIGEIKVYQHDGYDTNIKTEGMIIFDNLNIKYMETEVRDYDLSFSNSTINGDIYLYNYSQEEVGKSGKPIVYLENVIINDGNKNLEIENYDLIVNKSYIYGDDISIKLYNSNAEIFNSQLGKYEKESCLNLIYLESSLDIINNTIINLNFITDKDCLSKFKLKNNILDMKGDYNYDSIDEYINKNIIVESGFKGNIGNNIYLDDAEEIGFISSENLGLRESSIAIDRTDDIQIDSKIDRSYMLNKDILNKQRYSGEKIDIGAYEFQFKEPGKPEKPEKPGGGGGGGGGDKPKEPEEVIPKVDETKEIEEIIEPELNKEDHFKYIEGYEDGTVRPEANLSREETAAVFFRLLNDDFREKIRRDTHDFPDFPKDWWSAKHIGTLVNGKILEGYDDGSFRNKDKISRAELAAIVVRFTDYEEDSNSLFTDISGHWAEEYINAAVNLGWISGYPDGRFKPDQAITRAEFVTLVNNVLNRKVRKENVLEGMVEFKDLKENEWYYEAMIEAVNSHDYDRLEDGTEKWTKLTNPVIEM